MDDKNKIRFGELISAIAEDKQTQVSKVRLQILWEELKEYPIEKVEAAVKTLMRTRRYAGFPALADFVDCIEPQEDLNAEAEVAAREAWRTLWTEGESHGFNGWNNPAIPWTIIILGGWIEQAREIGRICQMNDSQIQEGIWRKGFMAVYRTIKRRIAGSTDKPPRMIGTIKEENEKMGYLTDDTGNPIQRAGRFLLKGEEHMLNGKEMKAIESGQNEQGEEKKI